MCFFCGRGQGDVVGASPVSSPAGADSLFFVLPKKVSIRKARPRWRLPLELMAQRGEGKNSLRADSFPSFFLPATEIQGAI
ncbi:hypothetical protein CO705_20215 [Ralstonia pickettii]|nr:hypothetical protein CO705_20215 [Ralstonia pickettii]